MRRIRDSYRTPRIALKRRHQMAAILTHRSQSRPRREKSPRKTSFSQKCKKALIEYIQGLRANHRLTKANFRTAKVEPKASLEEESTSSEALDPNILEEKPNER
ncbi:hypothetical protein O181_037996 [Austropuccinia psidii MF-1]|uniref:Uncharacterized protein n=1 Tax=Austropuccinia psidii MF-1 TaxID=1389203 RepID=A0A9Q3HBA1_9BASI|nr:hypothetical protein [Austropuccinia psidii MF-1]